MKSTPPTSNAGNVFQEALVHYQSGRLADALAGFNLAISRQPSIPLGHFYRGLVLYDLNRLEDALASYDRAIALRPTFAEAYNNRGNALLRLKRIAEALASYDRAIALKPDYAEAYNNQGLVLENLKRQDDALDSYDRAIAAKRDFAEAYVGRGNMLVDLGRRDEALASYDCAISVKPDYAIAHMNRGHLLRKLNREEEALASYDHAIAAKRDYARAYVGRGNVLVDLGRRDEALASYDSAISVDPDYTEAYWAKSNLLLLMGNYEHGWRLQEWRLKTWPYKTAIRNYSQPRWLGESRSVPLGVPKTLLIYGEAGFGDSIQFCRYVSMLAARNLKVILEVPSSLVSVMSTLEGNPTVVESNQPSSDFDLHCPIGSLPLAFGTTLATIPARFPYLFSDADKQESWFKRLGQKTKTRIGIVWSGQVNRGIDSYPAQRRSIPLRALDQLWQLPFECYSLQKDVRPDDAEVLANLEHLHDYRDYLNDFSDTAALIQNMDLVISIDTSVAHLAGALGRPVWVLLPFTADYRWTLTGTNTPWYPSATLFRQPTIGDWESVVAEVANCLRGLK